MWLYLNVPSPKASDPAMLRLTPVPATPGAADWVKWLRYNRVTKEVALRLLVGPTTTANARAWAPQYRAWFLNMTDKKGVAMFQDVLVEVLTLGPNGPRGTIWPVWPHTEPRAVWVNEGPSVELVTGRSGNTLLKGRSDLSPVALAQYNKTLGRG